MTPIYRTDALSLPNNLSTARLYAYHDLGSAQSTPGRSHPRSARVHDCSRVEQILTLGTGSNCRQAKRLFACAHRVPMPRGGVHSLILSSAAAAASVEGAPLCAPRGFCVFFVLEKPGIRHWARLVNPDGILQRLPSYADALGRHIDPGRSAGKHSHRRPGMRDVTLSMISSD